MDLGLNGKVAVITGSERVGIGTAKVLLDEEAKVVITSRQPREFK
jgi:NAD(P)-dependent dehydrogenase (short-subunit alcohol dehydrogenase family)